MIGGIFYEDGEVCVKQSLIPNADKGLFTSRDVKKNETITWYSGVMVDCNEADKVRPIYHLHILESVGLVCLGDERAPGRYANGQHPETRLPKANARFNQSKIMIVSGTSLPGGIKYVPGMHIKVPIVAKMDIGSGSEVIVKYGPGFWANNERWDLNPGKEISPMSNDRDTRMMGRQLYVAPSEHIGFNPVTKEYDLDLSAGLFCTTMIHKGADIVSFCGGEVINTKIMTDRFKAGKFGYFIKSNKHEILDCYESRMNNECKASCANSGHSNHPIRHKTTGMPGKLNCKFTKFYCKEREQWIFYYKAAEDIEPRREILGDYEPHIPNVDN